MNTITNVVVDILVNSKPIKQYNHKGKIFVESKDGTDYDIIVKNNNSTRVECVIAVDGINVISGDENTDKSTGYIINPYDTLKISGYRISDEKVASFKFCKRDGSYAKEQVTNAQNGIITVECFTEQVNFNWYTWNNSNYIGTDPWDKIKWGTPYTPFITTNDVFNGKCNSTNATANYCATGPLRSSSIQSSNIKLNNDTKPSGHFEHGTTFGKAKDSKVTTVSFTRGVSLGIENIYYTTRNSLKSIGVKLTNTQKIVFPVGSKKYCTPPKNWNSI